jgi:hypothetical protein
MSERRWEQLVGKTVASVRGYSSLGFLITFTDGTTIDYSVYGGLSGHFDPPSPSFRLELASEKQEREDKELKREVEQAVPEHECPACGKVHRHPAPLC